MRSEIRPGDRKRRSTSFRRSKPPPPSFAYLTILDPSDRYAEHRLVKALGEKDVFYYQGTKMIEEVELLLDGGTPAASSGALKWSRG